MKSKIKVSPYPSGKDFAFSIIDDTDYSWGAEIIPIYEALHSLGFRTTKTVWMFDQKFNNSFRISTERPERTQEWGASLQNEDYRKFVLMLKNLGFEIALHGVSAGNDYREDIKNGYEKFKELFGQYPKIDILHAQNIENLYSGSEKFDFWPLKILEKLIDNSEYQGHVKDSPYFWGDIAKNNVSYIRIPFHEINEINLLNINPKYPFHDPRRPYVNYWFTNSDGANHEKFMKITSNKNINKLEKEKGTTIIYTHFANGFSKKIGDKYIIDEDFLHRLKNIKSRNGWFPTASEILDRFINLRKIYLIDEHNGINIINVGDATISDLTLIVDCDTILKDSYGNIYTSDKNGKIIIPKIKERSVITLIDCEDNSRSKFGNNDNISVIEHIKIELTNYIKKYF